MNEEKIVECAVFETKDETYYLNPREGIKYILEFNYFGDHNENWIVVIKDGKAIEWHSLRFCVTYRLLEATHE